MQRKIDRCLCVRTRRKIENKQADKYMAIIINVRIEIPIAS